MFQRWCPLKCIKQGLPLIVLFSALLLPSYGFAKKQATASLPPLLREVEVMYSKSPTLSAKFSQLTDSVTMTQKKKSSGNLFVKRPSKVRWETNEPDVSLFVSDGSNTWFYTPPFDAEERGQLVERKASETQSKLTTALLTGSFSINKDMKFRQKTPFRYSLTPKPGSAGTVIEAIIDIDAKDKLIKKVTLEHSGGNHTEIRLSEIKLGTALKDALFTFKAPPNTDRVD